MTVRFYIAEDDKQNEKGFKNPAERESSLIIARAIWRKYRESSKLYAILFNIPQPPADIIVLTNDGIGVADLKDISGAISGSENAAWYITSLSGGQSLVKSGSRHKNPFQQVKYYREQIKLEVQRVAGILKGKPDWLIKGNFDVQSSIVITGGNYTDDNLNIDPVQAGSWFTIRHPDNIADWVYSLSFKGRQWEPNRLDNGHVEALAKLGFRTREWLEMEDMLATKDPYAFLVLHDSKGTAKHYYPLSDKVINVGRDLIVGTQIRENVVGRHHATIICQIEGVFLQDENSTNGTFVNGRRLNSKHILKNGDKIVMGPCDEKGKSEIDGSYLLYTTEYSILSSTKLWVREIKS